MAALLELVTSPSDITLSRVWKALAPAEREAALQSIASDKESRPQFLQMVMTLPRYRTFRPQAVARLKGAELVSALASASQVPNELIQTGLIRLHLPARASMLGAFLEALGIPHEGGLITEGVTVALPEGGRITDAIAGLARRFPPREVTIYLLSLVAIDPPTWQPLAAVLPAVAGVLGE
ncbi:MAG TPA: hypothetical protein VG817_09090 [Gemmatimonadales bacterium]|nr:hypothetical protein [Gemmatimonadales bacterium]